MSEQQPLQAQPPVDTVAPVAPIANNTAAPVAPAANTGTAAAPAAEKQDYLDKGMFAKL
jgi:hypothetical protein